MEHLKNHSNTGNKIDDVYGLKERELLCDNVEFTIKNNFHKNIGLNDSKSNNITPQKISNDTQNYVDKNKNKNEESNSKMNEH